MITLTKAKLKKPGRQMSIDKYRVTGHDSIEIVAKIFVLRHQKADMDLLTFLDLNKEILCLLH